MFFRAGVLRVGRPPPQAGVHGHRAQGQPGRTDDDRVPRDDLLRRGLRQPVHPAALGLPAAAQGRDEGARRGAGEDVPAGRHF